MKTKKDGKAVKPSTGYKVEISSIAIYMIHVGWTTFEKHQTKTVAEFIDQIDGIVKSLIEAKITSGNAIVIRAPQSLIQWSGVWISRKNKRITICGEINDASGNQIMSEDVVLMSRNYPHALLTSLAARINDGQIVTLQDIIAMDGIPAMVAEKAEQKEFSLTIRMKPEYTPWDAFKSKIANGIAETGD